MDNRYIRSLIGSWRFFDGIVDAAVLSYRTSNDGRNFSDWQRAIPKSPKRRFWNLFLNAYENSLFAFHALIEHFKDDLIAVHEGKECHTLNVSQELTRRLVLHLAQNKGNHFSHWQYRLECEAVDYQSEVFKL